MSKGAFFAIIADRKIPNFLDLWVDMRFDFWLLKDPFDFNGDLSLDRKGLAEVFKVILTKLFAGEKPYVAKEPLICPSRP